MVLAKLDSGHRHRLRNALVLASLLVAAPSAHAEDATPHARLRRLRRLLDATQAESEQRGGAVAAAQIATGAATLGIGTYAAVRGSLGPSLFLLAGGAVSTTSGLFALAGTRRDVELDASIRKDTEDGGSPAEALHLAEVAWYDAATSTRKTRRRSATVSMIVGTLLTGFGLTAAAVNLHVPSSSASQADRVSFGGALAGLGSFMVVGGAYTAFAEDPIESGWRTYATMSSPEDDGHFAMGLTLVPVAGGGGLGLTGTF